MLPYILGSLLALHIAATVLTIITVVKLRTQLDNLKYRDTLSTKRDARQDELLQTLSENCEALGASTDKRIRKLEKKLGKLRKTQTKMLIDCIQHHTHRLSRLSCEAAEGFDDTDRAKEEVNHDADVDPAGA